MSYEMKNLRKEDLSLYFYIKDIVLNDFREVEEYVQLKLMPELCTTNSYVYQYVSDLNPLPTELGRGWVYFDPPSGGLPCEPYTTVSGLNGDGDPAFGIPEQSNMIIVKEHDEPILCNGASVTGGTVVDWRDYMIDYIDGRIIATRKLINPSVMYYWNYVAVVDEWESVEASSPPVVVIDMSETRKKGYQLGGGKEVSRKVDLHIFASNAAERNDIVETLYDGLYNRSCLIYDFPTGSVLDTDGTFYGRKDVEDRVGYIDNKLTYLFDRSIVDNVSKLSFDSVIARNIKLPAIISGRSNDTTLSNLNAYRAKISFNMVSYDDRVIAGY